MCTCVCSVCACVRVCVHARVCMCVHCVVDVYVRVCTCMYSLWVYRQSLLTVLLCMVCIILSVCLCCVYRVKLNDSNSLLSVLIHC